MDTLGGANLTKGKLLFSRPENVIQVPLLCRKMVRKDMCL
jgi:hypothetical protein